MVPLLVEWLAAIRALALTRVNACFDAFLAERMHAFTNHGILQGEVVLSGARVPALFGCSMSMSTSSCNAR
jgi:hypothetical protein